MKRTVKYRLRFEVCLLALVLAFCVAVDTGSAQVAPKPPEPIKPGRAGGLFDSTTPSTTSATKLRSLLDEEKKKNGSLELQVRQLKLDLLAEKAKTDKLLVLAGGRRAAAPASRPAAAPVATATINDNGNKVVITSAAKLLGAGFAAADCSIILCAAAGGKSVELLLPGKPKEGVRTFKAGDQTAVAYSAKDAFGRARDVKLATVHVKDGKLIWEGKKIPSSIRSGKGFGEARERLRLATLHVSDGAESLLTCQFVPVAKLDLKLTGRSITAILPYSYAVCKPAMVLSADSSWTSREGALATSATFESSGGQVLTIGLKPTKIRTAPDVFVDGTAIEAVLTGSASPANVHKKLVVTERLAKRIFGDILLKKKSCKTYSPGVSASLRAATAEDLDVAIAGQISDLASAISTCSNEISTRKSALVTAESNLTLAAQYLPKKYTYTTSKLGTRRRVSTTAIDWAQEKQKGGSYEMYFRKYRLCQAQVRNLKKDKSAVVLGSLGSALQTYKKRLSAVLKERESLAGFTGTSSVEIVVRAGESKALLARGKLTVGVAGGKP